MSAPNIKSIFQLEEALEPAISNVLKSASQVQVLHTFSDCEAEFPHMEVQLEVGEQPINDHQGMVTISGQACQVPDTWNVTVIVRCVTNRQKGWLRSQAEMRSNARFSMLGCIDNFPASVVPYHELVITREMGTVLSVQAAEDLDVSEIRFAGWVSVRPDAWPAS